MQARYTQGLLVLQRTLVFLEKVNEIPVKMGPITKHVEAFKAVVDRLVALAAEQHEGDSGYREASTNARAQLRTIVREYVRPLTRSRNVLFPVDSPIRAALRIPSGGLGYGALKNILDGFVNRLEQHKAEFITAGFGSDFVEKIRAEAATLNKSLEEKGVHFGRRSSATRAVTLEYNRARQMVRMLDAMVSPRLEGTGMLAEWKSLTLFARSPKRDEPEGEGSTTPSPAPAPSSPSPNAVSPKPSADAA